MPIFPSGRWVRPLLVFLLLTPPLAYPQDVQSLIDQTTAAHGGGALASVGSCSATILWTDYRLSPSLPLPAVIKSYGKATRLEYTGSQGPVAQVRNGAWLWEVRGGQTQEFTGQPPIFQNGYFNPSLGIVRSLSAQEFAYHGAATLRGRSVHVLRKVYWTDPTGSGQHRGNQEFIYVFIDTATHLISQVDYTYGSDYNRLSLRFDNYTSASGVAVPQMVSHWLNNQIVWQIQVQSVSFNPGLSPRDFVRP